MGTNRNSLTAELSPIHNKMDNSSAANKIMATMANIPKITSDQLAANPVLAIMHQHMTLLLTTISTLSQQMDTLTQEMTAIRIQQQKSMNNDNSETVFEEQKRVRSIVIANLEESEEAKASQRVQHDLDAVTAILDECDAEFVPTAVYRMGKKNGRGPRLLKVELPTRFAVSKILSNKTNLKRSHSFKYIKVRASLSISERNNYKILTQKCKEARASTNRDFVVYSNAVIVRDLIPDYRIFLISNTSFVATRPIDNNDFNSFA